MYVIITRPILEPVSLTEWRPSLVCADHDFEHGYDIVSSGKSIYGLLSLRPCSLHQLLTNSLAFYVRCSRYPYRNCRLSHTNPWQVTSPPASVLVSFLQPVFFSGYGSTNDAAVADLVSKLDSEYENKFT